jgi:hypothetical protein
MDAIDYYKEIGVGRPYLIDVIVDLGLDFLPQEYINRLAEAIVDDVAEDMAASADKDEWGSGDVRFAVGRVLLKRLGMPT